MVSWAKKGHELLSQEIWCSEPTLDYFQGLARTTFLNFWKWEEDKLEPVKFGPQIPELIFIVDNSEQVVCRWSLQDELATRHQVTATL
jgi:hypothetical protein